MDANVFNRDDYGEGGAMAGKPQLNGRRALVLVTAVYLATRLWAVSGAMNEYFDYDEGTYLLIARFINHGILPYRDVIAVHPPFYYYLLALWMRIFGDGYVVGRSLSVVLGLAAIYVAYLTGRELRDWKLGALFATLITLDPVMVQMNSLVFHETSIELFTLLSLYSFVRYFKGGGLKQAYFSLFWAGLGTTSKFTIIPYAVALYFTVLFLEIKVSRKHLEGVSRAFLSRKQVYILLGSYALLISIFVSVVVLFPSDFMRSILIVPGVHGVETIGQLISVGVFLVIWSTLTVYAFRIRYIHPLLETCRELIENLYLALKLAVALIIPKLIVELPLGLLVSRDYVHQTYLSQSARYAPIINPFEYMDFILKNLRNGKPDYLITRVPLLLLLFLLFLALARGKKPNAPLELKTLLVFTFISYFLIFPVVPIQRFLYPFFLVLYVTVLYSLLDINVGGRTFIGFLIVSIIILGSAATGMAYSFPRGKLLIAWASHSRELRDDLGGYITSNSLRNGTYLSMNPFNAYYLHLPVNPRYLDVFGITYLEKGNLLEEAFNSSDYVLVSTWTYAMMEASLVFKERFGRLLSYCRQNCTLLFGGSYERGDVMELYMRTGFSKNVSFSPYFGKVRLWLWGRELGYLSIDNESSVLIKRTASEEYLLQVKGRGRTLVFKAIQSSGGVKFLFPNATLVTLEFVEPAVIMKDSSLAGTGQGGTFRVYLARRSLEVDVNGTIERISERKVVARCSSLGLRS